MRNYFKKIVLIFVTTVTAISYSAEINLYCSGIASFYSSSRGMNEKIDKTIEVAFDDIDNKIISVSASSLFGCSYETEGYSHTCYCKITDALINCTAESKVISGGFNSNQTVRVNRYTGILTFSEITQGVTGKANWSTFISGDLKCESFSKKKF